ncbi:putative Disease resistance protein [Cocos nucifera]|nr:putative Disease resistance protein [Cocos nucifera]
MELIQPVVDIIKLLWDPIAHRVNYFVKIEENMRHLRSQVKKLTASREDLKNELERAASEGNVPTNVVQVWLKEADEIIKKAEETQAEFEQNKKCFYGWCLDCRSRYELGKRIVKETPYVQDHREQKDSFGEIAVPPMPEPVSELPTTTIREGVSTIRTLDRVWNWLMDAKAGIIGIWGKGGVGKTTLVKNINNKLRGTEHFEVVIFVTLSRDWNIKNLRNDIAKEILLDLSAEEDETRASRLLFNNLKGKKFLLILDDMWEKVDLEKIGVPAPKENGSCKIVIATRKRGVCNDMETDEEIMVEVLSDTEAWELFQKKVGSVISSDLEPIALDVCKECHGLPLAIIVVGRALRKEANREVWKNALRVLKTSQFELKGMEREVYLPLKFTYDHLKNDSENDILQNCFLYCSLFPEGYPIKVDRLIEYWTIEGFIEGVESLKDASAKGHYLLKELIDSCLLEKDKDEKNAVRMHDVIRDMAIKITSECTERGRRFLVRASLGLEDCPEVEKWEEKDRISLMNNNIRFLPDEPKCTGLSTLVLRGNEFLQEIPQSFFKQMKNLRVLDLSYTGVMLLPPSISELGGLQALILRFCRYLQSVDHVGGLKQLQLLDLSCTGIVGLPREIKQLTRLRRLNLSGTFHLACIPVDIIVSLSLLEDLEMRLSSFGRSNESKAFIENLGRLNRLTHFTADIPNDFCTSSQWEFLLWDKLKSFHLGIVGRGLFITPFSVEPKRRGRYLDITANANVRQEAVGLLQFAEMLRLYNHDAVRTISAMGARNLKRLKECVVWQCRKMENVVITEEAEEGILPELEVLRLIYLPNLRSIWEGNGTPGSFRSIKSIILRSCASVMHLFSSNVLQLLNSLENLYIEAWTRMVKIVRGEVGNGVITLPKLRRIVLKELCELNKMWEGVLYLESLQAIEVTSCPSLRQLAIDIEKTPALEVIQGESEWWNSLKWQNDSSKSHFQNRFKLQDQYVIPDADTTNKYFINSELAHPPPPATLESQVKLKTVKAVNQQTEGPLLEVQVLFMKNPAKKLILWNKQEEHQIIKPAKARDQCRKGPLLEVPLLFIRKPAKS